MSQKILVDVEEIAKINKVHREFCLTHGINPTVIDSISKHQADYFEKEDKHYKLVDGRWASPFNREQFLKDAGVK